MIRHSALRAFAYRDYRLFFFGQLVSLVGTWMQSVAQSWLVYRLTGSAALLGMVGFAGQFPVCLLSPLGGVLADARSRHRIIIATQTASMVLAFILAVLALSGAVRIWHVFVLASMLGVVNAFDIPARQAFLVDLVGRSDLMNAIALNSSMFNGARIVGPAIAGLLVAVVGEGWCFFLNGVSYIAVIAGLLLMHPKERAVAPSGSAPPSDVMGTRPLTSRRRFGDLLGAVFARIAEGFRFVGRTRPIRDLLLLLGLVSLAGMPYAVLMPIFADRILHAGAGGLGLLMGASGVGALIGALTLAARRDVRGLGRWIAWAAAGFGASLIGFASSHALAISALLLFAVGYTMIIQTAASNTLVQAMVPDALRGRVMATYSMMFMGMAPLGALLEGLLASRVGAPATVMVGGSACIAGAVVFGARLPALRAEGRQLLLSQEAAAGTPPSATAQAETMAASDGSQAQGPTSKEGRGESGRRPDNRPAEGTAASPG